MREMVLNHASLQAYYQPTAVQWLKGMAAGMAELVKDGVAQATLRMSRSIYETHCMPGWSLWDAVLELRKRVPPEERRLIMALFSKSRLLSEVDPDIEDRLRGCYEEIDCEEKTLPPEDGEPLLLCAITDWIAVGFPTDGWNRNQLTIRFEEMIDGDDGSTVEVSKTIDNLALSAHARTICGRHHQRQRDARRRCRNGAELWEVREVAFPNLVFGPDVEGHIAELGGADLGALVDKLTMLDALTAAWRNNRAPAPPGWSEAGVRNEGETVRRMNPELREERRFRSRCGPRNYSSGTPTSAAISAFIFATMIHTSHVSVRSKSATSAITYQRHGSRISARHRSLLAG